MRNDRKLSPAIKGQLTKVRKEHGGTRFLLPFVRKVFEKHMPREQAKHAAKHYLAAIQAV